MVSKYVADKNSQMAIVLVIQILVRGLDADGQSLKNHESDESSYETAEEDKAIFQAQPTNKSTNNSSH